MGDSGNWIEWRGLKIDRDELRIYRADGGVVTLVNQDKPLNPLTVEILIQLIENKDEWVFGRNIEDWQGSSLASRNSNFTSHMSMLRTSLGLPRQIFDADFTTLRRRRKSDDEVGFKFVGQMTGPSIVHQISGARTSPHYTPQMDKETVLEIAEELGIDGPDLLQKVLTLRDEPGRPAALQTLRDGKERIRRRNLNTSLLKDYYKQDKLAEEGLALYSVKIEDRPVLTNIAVPKRGLGMKVDLETSLGHSAFTFVGRSPSIPKFEHDDLAELLANAWLTGTQAVNDPVLCLQEMKRGDPTGPMSFSMATYFDFRLSWGQLDNELSRALIETGYSIPEVIRRKTELLSHRETLLPTAGSIVSCGSRLCVGGVNVVFALRRFNRDQGWDDFMFYIAERSTAAVAFAQGEQSIIPSGFHTVLVEKPFDGWVSPWQSVYRELGEELFGRDEAISRAGKAEFDPRGADCPPVYWFRGREGKVIHEIVSFGFDVIDGSYQFGILLVVEDTCYWDTNGGKPKLNYEYKHPGRKAISVSTMDRKGLTAILQNPMCAQTSIFTLIPALQRLKELEPNRVDLPHIELTSR